MYWFSRSQPCRIAVSLAVGLPTPTPIISGKAPAIRISQRLDDGNLQARLVKRNGVELTWAPDDPGWPRERGDWYKAQQVCQHLSEGGLTIEPTPQNIWRLPTVDEAVRSMTRYGQNRGGVRDTETVEATYETIPNKESPLWIFLPK